MARKALKERTVTIPQVKEALETIGEERLDPVSYTHLTLPTILLV